jgi:transposase
MQKRDGRCFSDEVLEVLRERAVALLEAGSSQLAIAAALGAHKNTVSRWLKAWRAGGEAALQRRKRGRRAREQMRLSAAQAGEIRKLVTDKCPDQLKLPFALWSREAVRDLIRLRLGIALALRTVGDYLQRWGFTPQRPVKRALERQDAKIQGWLVEDYPKIAARAKAEGAEIHWGDETGISNQASYGRSFAPKGRTPVIARTAKRHTTSMISTVTNRGTARFMIYAGALNTALFLGFLKRLVRGAGHKIFLVVDNLKVHHANRIKAWVADHQDKIELFFLPPYAPEHNPDEFLNNDVKQSLGRQAVPKDQPGLQRNLRRYMRRLQRQPQKIQAFFRAPTTAYAA